MNKDIIYRLREDQRLYEFLKYNSFLYKDIIRGTITYKRLVDLMKQNLKLTISDRLNSMNEKIELANSLLNIFK